MWRRRAERDEGRAGGRRGAPRRVAAVALLAEGEVDVAAVGALPVARRRPRPQVARADRLRLRPTNHLARAAADAVVVGAVVGLIDRCCAARGVGRG